MVIANGTEQLLMNPFRAFRIHQAGREHSAGFESLNLDDVSDGDVIVRVTHSSVNYKDALAATGEGRILRRSPLVGGIDMAGVVVESADARFTVGDRVLATGSGLSETRDGGYAEMFRSPADVLVPTPDALSNLEAMQIGTAGFTAALAIHRMEQNGQSPAGGAIVVTGATGGVGSLAIDMLASLGYDVVAVSGKDEAEPYLRALGADRVIDRRTIDFGSRPLEAAEWGGAVDNLGGDFLTWLTRTVDYGGNIASIGLASGFELNTTVMPFILRAVSLLGINSVDTPRDLRVAVWARLAGELRPRHLERIGHKSIGLDELPDVFQGYIDGSVTGRCTVHISDE